MTANTIIYDSLGSPAPYGLLSHYGGREETWNGAPVCTCHTWHFSSTGKVPELEDAVFYSFSTAVAAVERCGYTVGPQQEDGGSHLVHQATLQELERRKAAHAAKWEHAKPCYVRYGKVPADGHSRNHADGTVERGVSVFRGERLPNGEARAIPTTNQELGSLLSLRDRDLYIVTGTEIGVGSDGEPLLANCRIWRRAK